MSAFVATFRRDLALMWGAGGGALAPLGFFLGATLLVPLAMGPERALLQSAGPPLVWIAAALAVLATLERLFQADLEDGSLDQMLLSPPPLEVIVLAKGAALWVAIGLPLALAAAPAAIALQTPPERALLVAASLALGMIAFIGAGLVGAAVTAGVKRGGVLIALIVLPFFAPPIIFGASVAAGEEVGGAFLVLAGLALGRISARSLSPPLRPCGCRRNDRIAFPAEPGLVAPAMLSTFANPARFMSFSAWAAPLCLAFALALFAIGLPWGLFYSPADYQQGETVRIMYVHVPAAWWSLGIYTFMAIASFVALVWRHALADVAARAAAPIGATFAAICLATGSLWGRPTWGTWWEWDGRLTSMLVLFIIYLGYIALWNAVEEEEKAARLAAILCLAGIINIPIVHFSVDWWSTLHQPASILRAEGPSIHPAMLGPLFTMAGAYLLLFAGLTMMNMRAAIYRRRIEATRLRGASA